MLFMAGTFAFSSNQVLNPPSQTELHAANLRSSHNPRR